MIIIAYKFEYVGRQIIGAIPAEHSHRRLPNQIIVFTSKTYRLSSGHSADDD